MRLPFVPGMIYNRRDDIHRIYGGSWQSGICPSSTYPYIFIFTGDTGHLHGYQDGWENEKVFSYTGEGQSGDMEFKRGNLALMRHKEDGKRVFLFEKTSRGFVRFQNEVELFDYGFFDTKDSQGNMRVGIKFFFKPPGVYVPEIPELELHSPEVDSDIFLPNETERQGLVTSRVGQGAYRKRIIHHWEYECAVTGFDKLDLLIASHIVPWKDANDYERLDVNNGILLSPAYDALFDRNYVSFDQKGNILLSDKIDPRAYEQIGVTGKEAIRKAFNMDQQMYLDKHRQKMFAE